MAEGFEKNKTMEDFREEIKQVAKKETAAHFKHGPFDPEELTEDDLSIWEKVKDGTVTIEDVDNYRKTIGKDVGTRRIFLGFIGNKAMAAILNK